MRHDPATGALVIMLRSLKMHGMAQAVDELAQQGAPAFEAAVPVLSQLLKAETAEREVRSMAYPPSISSATDMERRAAAPTAVSRRLYSPRLCSTLVAFSGEEPWQN